MEEESLWSMSESSLPCMEQSSMGPPSTQPTGCSFTEVPPRPVTRRVLAQFTGGCYPPYCCWCKKAKTAKTEPKVAYKGVEHYRCAQSNSACAAWRRRLTHPLCAAHAMPWYTDANDRTIAIIAGAKGDEEVEMLALVRRSSTASSSSSSMPPPPRPSTHRSGDAIGSTASQTTVKDE
jgi:hypothetical protein